LRRRLPQTALGTELRRSMACNVRSLREQKGMTQADLADASGLARTFVNKLERGHVSVALETIGALANALEIPPRKLLEPAD
jgi:transcriptional regulator with XRE-family HTH domain